jgi:hypothetical protein
VGQKLSPLEIIRISLAFRSFDDKLSFWSLLISLCLENLRFRLIVSPEVKDDSDGIFLVGLIPSLNNFWLEFCRYLADVRLYCWYPRTSSANLDKFVRSLRIKEYLLAKERDFPVDGSFDSEDDNEIPLPRYKKKGSWISKPNKNTTLESFIDLVTNDVQRAASTNIPTHNNLTPAEKGAIQKLKERDNIGIKPADKCSSVCYGLVCSC